MLDAAPTPVAAGAFVARCERAALGPAGRVVAPDARICPACSDATFGVLCYQYRVAIPADQLPAAPPQPEIGRWS